MSGSLFLAEERFPRSFASESTEEKLSRVEDYLYFVSEQLSYTLRNLDARNLSPAGLADITSPLYARIQDEADGLRTEIEASAGSIRAEVAANYLANSARAGIVLDAIGGAKADIYVEDANGRSSLEVRGGTIELKTNITEVNGLLHIGGNNYGGTGEIQLNRWCNIYATSYEDLVFQAGDGGMFFSCYGDMELVPDGEVKIYVGSAGRYWSINNRGIDWCESDGTVLKSVVLE